MKSTQGKPEASPGGGRTGRASQPGGQNGAGWQPGGRRAWNQASRADSPAGLHHLPLAALLEPLPLAALPEPLPLAALPPE